LNRNCRANNERGGPCGQPPLVDSDFCFWHDPASEKEAADARRLGGANHRKEKALQGIYGVGGLETVADIRRILDLAITGVLPLSDSINRARVLIQAASAAARLLETGELEKRVQDIESVVGQRPKPESKKHSWWQR
jgi:hypothetical protein